MNNHYYHEADALIPNLANPTTKVSYVTMPYGIRAQICKSFKEPKNRCSLAGWYVK
jgi:hypothetical protein